METHSPKSAFLRDQQEIVAQRFRFEQRQSRARSRLEQIARHTDDVRHFLREGFRNATDGKGLPMVPAAEVEPVATAASES